MESSSHAKGVIVAPTASGKSLLIAELANRLGGKTLVFQPNKELLEQNYAKYTSYGNKAGIYSASAKSKTIDDVTFATIGSVKKIAPYFKSMGFKNICIDEAHWASKPDSMLAKFITEAGVKNVVGFTATPVILRSTMQGSVWKMLNRTRDSIFSKIVDVVQIKQMLKEHWWSPISYETAELDLSGLKLNTTGTDFKHESLIEFYNANELEQKIYLTLERLADYGIDNSIIFFPSVDEAASFASKLDTAEVLHADTPSKERARIIHDFRNGKIRYLCNVNILTLGFDHPPLTSVIMARPTNSFTVFYQQIGRGVRLYEGKRGVTVVDLAGNTARFGKVEDIEFADDAIYGWGMYSNGVKLTDIPLSEIPDSIHAAMMHREEFLANGEKLNKASDLIFNFGKYRGTHLLAVPNHYLEWMVREYSFGSKIGFRKAVSEELIRRKNNNIII